MPARRHELKDFPVNIELDFPIKKDNTPTIFSFIGWILLVVGGLFIIFGPEKIYYNTMSGMTFVQMLQAYPGPIASVGALIIGGAEMLSNNTQEKQAEYVLLSVYESLNFEESDLPEGKRLDLNFIDNKTITVDIVDIAETESEDNAQSETLD